MASKLRSLRKVFLYECLFALTFWNLVSLSVGQELFMSVSNNFSEDGSDKGVGGPPLLHTNNRQSKPNFDWVVVENTTESLSLSEITNNNVNDLIALLSNFRPGSRLHNLTLTNVSVDWTALIDVLQTVWHSSVEYLNLNSVTQLSDIIEIDFDYSGTSMKALTMKKVSITDLYFMQNDLYKIFADMNIEALTISESEMIHMLCPSSNSAFRYLNFLKNDLTDFLFQSCKKLVKLETLILQKNKFESLSKVSFMTSRMKLLKYLDMSSNLLSYEGPAERCRWAESLSELDLSSNQLTDAVFECLPVNVQKLELQNNQISSVPRGMAELKSLRELNLASNRLADLPGCGGFPSLAFLNVEMNVILTPLVDFFQSCPRVRELQGGHNPFKCSCELQAFVRLERRSGGKLFGWPGAYVCEYPEELRGRLLEDFHLAELACNTTLLLVTALVVTLALVAVVAFLCVYLDVPWYARMTWQWTQTKRRARHQQPQEQEGALQFHAFVSYSERDAAWVKEELMPNLERGEGRVQLCQHERNFIPGKSIVENIITCIEKSYRSIFVLSPNFVQSEWCHYELYFAHHKLFSETSNSLILILLEPIPPYVIPARYHKLKALMAKRTYLEWPKERSKQPLFWANLRAAINVKLPVADGQRCGETD
ncbi:PREDICTED: toll-like receptor 1 [Calidris pugnax]|uniref:toll-like receptor 1 n=2 Tax=Calidris pugnax TaxID=198806 RepID=UPI00071DACED|nr:PREDICTED: toll-like receptor 1 [Calidris pugnax]XP_014793852.1 PREDICTED: toll-like receptor 1 [Calidris pugnax]XP_014793853.1 PREDICTED: toll-like receptor 1 [Calidris pugnax]XP_014793854.1 PREDICTED: toll-like receptor 1 [Calidris pugnax]XP_014793855.1 PREDICTED: toll-like receptor 1 [Calidris pugnax]